MVWIVLMIVASLAGFAFGWMTCEVSGNRILIGIEFGKLLEPLHHMSAFSKKLTEQARDRGQALGQASRSDTESKHET